MKKIVKYWMGGIALLALLAGLAACDMNRNANTGGAGGMAGPTPGATENPSMMSTPGMGGAAGVMGETGNGGTSYSTGTSS